MKTIIHIGDWVEDDYPTEAALAKVSEWPYEDMRGCFEFVKAIWAYPDYATKRGRCYRYATGGWSGNESLIAALKRNQMIWLMCWQSSERGGLHIFEVPKVQKSDKV